VTVGEPTNRWKPSNTAFRQREIGQRLRWLREAMGEIEGPERHTQLNLARTLRRAHSAVSRWESGETAVPAHVVNRIVFAYGASWNYVYGGIIDDLMDPEVAAILRREHGTGLMTPTDFRNDRDVQTQVVLDLRSAPSRASRKRPKRPGDANEDGDPPCSR
jgi:transcriptional regulator with XRE-family HTH domain